MGVAHSGGLCTLGMTYRQETTSTIRPQKDEFWWGAQAVLYGIWTTRGKSLKGHFTTLYMYHDESEETLALPMLLEPDSNENP